MIFCGAEILGSLALDNDMSNIPKNHISRATSDGNLVRVSITTLIRRQVATCYNHEALMNVHLDPQHGKVEHQIHLPQYFVLIDIGVQT
jgi:hypothetical protein